MKIGKRLRFLRKQQRLTLKELSKESGVAIATLSRMEHDIMTGTLESHVRICRTLGIGLADFYREIENAAKDVSLSRKKDEHDSLKQAKDASVELLTTRIMNKKMMPTLIRIKKGGKTYREENKPGTEKFLYILSGIVTAEIAKDEHRLGAGDSLYFDASLPHRLRNSGKQEAVALSILSPPEF